MQCYSMHIIGALGAMIVVLTPSASFCQQETAQGAVTGVIEQVDAKARSIKVKLELESKTFQVAKDAKIFKKKEEKGTVNDEPGTFADLKVGDPVIINYTEEKGALVAQRIAPKKPTIGGGG